MGSRVYQLHQSETPVALAARRGGREGREKKGKAEPKEKEGGTDEIEKSLASDVNERLGSTILGPKQEKEKDTFPRQWSGAGEDPSGAEQEEEGRSPPATSG